jgi:D-alanyl-D-alanine carboxypeptidase
MAIISRALMKQPLLRTVVATERHEFNGPSLWLFRNINGFLSRYPGAVGIKTGYETRAGRCLAASATRDGRQLISVVLNSDRYLEDSVALMDYGFSMLAARQSEPHDVTEQPSEGRIERAIRTAAGTNEVVGQDRWYLRGTLQPLVESMDPNSAVDVGSGSVYERLTHQEQSALQSAAR